MDYLSPAVSIITPAYKRVDYLAEAIKSALDQTFSDFELVVCDDSAEPKIEALCRSYEDPRIIYRANEQRLGIAMNNYRGFQTARSDLLTKLDDDDRWTPNFLEKLVPVMLSNSEICLAFSDHWLIDSEGNRMLEASEEQTTKFGRHFLNYGLVKQPKLLISHKSIPLASSAVFRKSAIDWSTYSEKVGGAYDLFLSSCLVSSGMEVFYVPERLTEYRLHSGSGTSNRRLQNSLETLWVSEKIYTNTYFQDIASDYRNICSYNSKITGNAYLHERQLISALLYYIQAIKYHFIA
ncbi:glycosyltransferase [Dolichospermum sp. ST_sed1]|nr:glycosyltransferase [Dolichospermum sp. ST_sed1]MDD1426581.1 glycosyltransferase [Dolichospermum sp. ST_sed9]MDD1430637.1 glycosyltransferase [Dolichospermum sp. ST_sed6]MDD1442503.1 glycosyltransferase [Dolichospermum sp. ST_sed3]MDD1444677.1 glycosyltransferase [Dolichospermum sp. ST_sed8]MDD1455598.1 glycosyltransferase [Dolichospermum sp. ST_sed7]MDD1462281.1 glycosyltransferase [Dolichospermum sp. ST_sed2]MDD1466505.1 glycosyltransferase [Dolichospermum sp. ST_sed5]